jgi:hypothetical protein
MTTFGLVTFGFFAAVARRLEGGAGVRDSSLLLRRLLVLAFGSSSSTGSSALRFLAVVAFSAAGGWVVAFVVAAVAFLDADSFFAGSLLVVVVDFFAGAAFFALGLAAGFVTPPDCRPAAVFFAVVVSFAALEAVAVAFRGAIFMEKAGCCG